MCFSTCKKVLIPWLFDNIYNEWYYLGEDASEGLNSRKEDFIIIVQSPIQKSMAQMFAAKGVAIDVTNGTTFNNFL